jgi:peroxiredoxin Q/BCP
MQACSLRDTYADFKNLNTEIIGISPDLSKKLLNFENKQNLNFNLLSDPEHKIAEAYGVWGLKKFMGREFMGIIRSTFIIDKSGIIRLVMPKVNTKTHHEDALLWIKENNL